MGNRALITVLAIRQRFGASSYAPETGFEEIDGDFPQADFGPRYFRLARNPDVTNDAHFTDLSEWSQRSSWSAYVRLDRC
jgi:hypothetical protein